MMANADRADPKAETLQRPLLRLLRPLVRLLIRSGITYPSICDLLRELYVNVAEHDFALAEKEQTDSRVSLLTGIHRKEVRRLRGAGVPLSPVPVALSRTSRIVARWLGGAPYSDAAGRPLPLPRIAQTGAPSFETLVESITRDVRPRAVLDEWLDRKLVAIDAADSITLLEQAFIPRAGDEQQLYYFGRNLHDHIAASVSNVLGGSSAFMERAVHYDGLSKPAALRLEARSRELASDAQRTANLEAQSACETDEGGRWRWNFGVYVYVEQDQEPLDAVNTPQELSAETPK
jgi:hypothetical protein